MALDKTMPVLAVDDYGTMIRIKPFTAETPKAKIERAYSASPLVSSSEIFV